jgi:hypothetical protein
MFSGGDSSPATGPLVVTPANPTVTVTITDGVVSASTLQLTATRGGQTVTAMWTVDQGAIASISSGGLFTATGLSGGTTQVTATSGGATGSTTVTVVIKDTQNGFTGTIDLTGAGGYGGVGGEGPGGPVTSSQQMALQQTPTADPARTFLYPYDQTVWPRGLLAPLLQWTQGASDPTAIAIHLQSQTFVYDGYFGRPAALGTNPFIRHPIPQDVWQLATESTAGTDHLAVSVTFLAGGATVGPISETWVVAPGILQGTVYYESYGTELVTNSDFTAQDGSHVGGAVLGIKPGDPAPHVVAGTNSPSGMWGQGCRGCHQVAAGGSRLITQDNVWGYDTTSLYNLATLAESTLSSPATCTLPGGNTGACNPATFAWAGLSPDGQYVLTDGADNSTDNSLNETQLFQISSAGVAAQMSVTGLPPGVQGMMPAFSPDEMHVAFSLMKGSNKTLGSLTPSGQVVVMSFDPTGPSMGSPTSVFSPPAGDCVGAPSFMPTNDSLLVELQLSGCQSTHYPVYVGTGNVNGEVWWTDIATGTTHRLDALNGYSASGTSYLPTGPNNHSADAKLNYLPSVNPAPSGGYAWVIFTSRRLYGNVATIDPQSSDPRYYDYKHQITTKKLWVAAINLNAPAGTDPSHPAFYLPAQELQAGNNRGYWVLDPCKPDGNACGSGDECCGGYCETSGEGGGLVCQHVMPSCAQYGDKCQQASNCCDPAALCIDGICAQATAQ